MPAPITTFHRIEKKYILTLRQKEIFLKEFGSILSPDNYGENNGYYTLKSIYYDTKDLLFYGEKIDHIRNKKIRIRYYLTKEKDFTFDTKVFVEIKEKIDGVTKKRRVSMKYQEAVNFLEHRIIPVHEKKDVAIISEIYDLVSQYRLIPQALTSYDRQAFFGKDTSTELRMTFDTAVTYKRQDISFSHDGKSDGKIVDEKMTILEVKALGSIPGEIESFFVRNKILSAHMSKYCRAIESSQNHEIIHQDNSCQSLRSSHQKFDAQVFHPSFSI